MGESLRERRGREATRCDGAWQQAGHVAATAKHFLGDGATREGVDQGDSRGRRSRADSRACAGLRGRDRRRGAHGHGFLFKLAGAEDARQSRAADRCAQGAIPLRRLDDAVRRLDDFLAGQRHHQALAPVPSRLSRVYMDRFSWPGRPPAPAAPPAPRAVQSRCAGSAARAGRPRSRGVAPAAARAR